MKDVGYTTMIEFAGPLARRGESVWEP